MLDPKCVLSVFLTILATVGALSSSNPQVQTRFGTVQGKLTMSARGRLVANFLGVPYAYPPLGDLRFRSPVLWNLTWDTPYYALSDSIMCAQMDKKGNVIGTEDCLYLNIFVPLVSNELPPANKLPVMVYVHGGGYNTGSSDSHRFSPRYLLDQNVVLVTMNYRLNALGFFSSANRAAPGNYGMKDILAALRWVNENIGDFYGDPETVTLWGHSTGAAAVHILLLSENAQGLFHRSIMQAESSNETETTTESQQDGSEELDDSEDIERDEEMMECMRTVPAEKLLSLTTSYSVWKGNPYCVFGPTVEEPSEDAVVTKHPLTAIRNHLYPDMPMMLGVAEDEGLLKTIKFYVDFDAEEEMIDNFDLYLPYVLEYHELVENFTAFSKAVEEFYFDGNISTMFRQNITEVVGDGLITWPVYRAAKLHAQHGNSSIYFYRFSYEGTFTKTLSTGIPMHYGVAHGDEMNYLFPILNYEFRDQLLHNTEDDTAMINVMTEMWTAFATHGVPAAWMTPTWPNFAETGQLMRFGLGRSSDLAVDHEFLRERMAFWENATSTFLVEESEDDDSMTDPPEDIQLPTDFAPTFHSNKLLLSTLVIIILGICRWDLA